MKTIKKVKDLFSIALVLLAHNLFAQTRHTFTHPAMGTEFRITISTADTTGLQTTIDSAFNRIDALEQMMSDYRAGGQRVEHADGCYALAGRFRRSIQGLTVQPGAGPA